MAEQMALAPETAGPKADPWPPRPAPAAPPPEIPDLGPEDLEAVRKTALEWAIAAGLVPPLAAAPPERLAYPKFGHGYSVLVSESASGGRTATAKFDASGRPSMWTLNGKGTQ